jgi:glycogen debranching enzyme
MNSYRRTGFVRCLACTRIVGDVWERDSAYHQGTVWPWLMGPFLTACARVNDGSEVSRAMAARWLGEFSHEMRKGCLGQIGEVADGDAPHSEGGCVAWSVAELLRAAVEDVYGRKPACAATALVGE